MFRATSESGPTRPRRLFTISLFLLLVAGLLFARPALAQNSGIFGFVSDAQGRAIGGAVVRPLSGPTPSAGVTTNTSGAYTLSGLAPGQYTFSVTKAGFLETTGTLTLFADETTRVDFTLATDTSTGGILQGHVYRVETGQLVPGAVVQAIGNTGGSFSTQSDASGFYRFANLTPGTFRVTASRAGLVTLTRSALTVRASTTTVADMNLRTNAAQLGVIQGTLLDASGNPVAGAQVKAVSGASQGLANISDGTGFYRLSGLLPDTYVLRVTVDGFLTRTSGGIAVGAGQTTTANIVLQSSSGATSSFEGFVFDISGSPIQGARVEIVDGPVVGGFSITDSTGFYRLTNLPAGTYSLAAAASGYTASQQVVLLGSGVSRRFDFKLQPSGNGDLGGITGQVTDSDGAGIAAVQVLISSGPAAGEVSTTDANGRYVLRNLQTGTYSVTFQNDEFGERTVTGIRVTAPTTTVVDVSLGDVSTGTGIAGNVTDTNGAVLSGVTVTVLQGSTVVTSGSTDAEGNYTFADLNAGTYSVRFTKTGYQSITRGSVQVTAGQLTTVDVQLTATQAQTGSITGTVTDNSGRAVAGATVDLLVQGSVSRATTTSSSGTFQFASVAAGSYGVRVTAGNLPPVTQTITVTAGQTTRVNFVVQPNSGAGSVGGQVRAPNGIPIMGAQVTIIRGPRVGQRVVTGKDGRFNFVGLTPGSYTLQFTAGGYRSVQRTVTVRAGNAPFLIVTLAKFQ